MMRLWNRQRSMASRSLQLSSQISPSLHQYSRRVLLSSTASNAADAPSATKNMLMLAPVVLSGLAGGGVMLYLATSSDNKEAKSGSEQKVVAISSSPQVGDNRLPSVVPSASGSI